ncbi:DUF998 domain-containing protein [Marinactinospora rubrisoli]|uniref:DUF998 domain-containing protein n=1 Tax=Marinactinospora rubrisoli TaxID=2715399 RepID=A0ABW2K996_9ACTN
MKPSPWDAVRWAGRIAALLAAPVYTLWALEFVLPTGLDATVSFVSELQARDRPYAGFFRVGDLISGALSIAAGAACLAAGAPGRWPRVTGLALVVFGAATVVDASVPMDCAVSVSARCAALDRAHEFTTTHTYSSSVAGAAALVGGAALTLAVRPVAVRAFAALCALLVVEALALAVSLVLLALGFGEPVPGFGTAQRVHVSAIALWLLAVGVLPALWDGRTRGPGGESPAPAH